MAKKTSTAQPKWTTDQIKIRAHASACALHAFAQQLEAVDARLQAVEKERLTKATQTYRSIMREDYANPPSPDVKIIHYDTACEGLATHDAVLEANSLARKARKAERDRVGKALREFLTTRPTADNQLQLLPPASDASGLGLYTDEARLVAYTALVELDKTGGLDDDQRALMVDLAGAGIEPIAFVLDAGEAVEESDDEPSEDDEQVLHEIDELGSSRVLQPAANDLVL